jgi:hypothetical protein
MKYLSFIAVVLLCCLQSHAQDKFFEQALKDGRSKGNTYKMINPKGKWLSQEDVEKYARAKDLLLGSFEYKIVNKFGKPAETIVSLQFLPRSEYPKFILEKILPSFDYSNLNKIGKVVLPDKLLENAKFALFDVAWIGQVDAKGYITGDGFGFFEDHGLFRYFKGTFQNGRPVGSIDFLDYNHKGYNLYFNPNNIIQATMDVNPINNDATLVVHTPASPTKLNTSENTSSTYKRGDLEDLAIGLVGTGIIAYGLFKLLPSSGKGASSSYSSYSGLSSSYTSSSSIPSSNSEDQNVDIEKITLSDFIHTIDNNWWEPGVLGMLNPELVTNLVSGTKFKDVRIKDKDGKEVYSGRISKYPDRLFINVLDKAYDSETNAIIALYAYFKYGKWRETGRM